jgi:TatD DNase family protein
MDLIDTHAHLASRQFTGETDALLHRCRLAGVTQVVSIGTQPEDSARNVALAAAHQEVYATVGVHPTSVHEAGPDWFERISELARAPKVVALGEMGLDYFHPPQDGSEPAAWRALQARMFERQLELAQKLGLPVVIHQRESSADVLAIMRGLAGKVRAVFHCFVGSVQEAEELLALGFYLSFTGVVTYKSAAALADCATTLPLNRIMVETDAPYLAPVPHRGSRNEPAYVRATAEFLASRRGLPLDELASATSATAREFFGLKSSADGKIGLHEGENSCVLDGNSVIETPGSH